MKIRILATGGTFDKEYNELTGELFFRKTHLPEVLRLGRCKQDIAITELMMIDSLNMTGKHRQTILDACLKCREDRIVVTHGTDTMVETAKLLDKNIADKTVVLTGAMVPYQFGSSDGMFNLGSALAFAQSLPYGVYIAMNGKLFHSENVRKNRAKGEFESVSTAKPATRAQSQGK
jgi:L-asparaginase